MEAKTYSRDTLAQVLREHDINPTHQRMEIAYALFSRGERLSAEQIITATHAHKSETSKKRV